MKHAFLVLFLTATGLFAQAPLAPLPPDGFVTLEQIVNEFSTQPDAALKKYQGQRVLVYGRVGQVEKSDDSEGNPLTVFLQLAQNPTPDVKCVFGISAIPKREQDAQVEVSEDGTEAVIAHRNEEGNINWQRPFIEEGQNVGIRGTFDNFVAGDIILKDSRKLRPEFLMKVLREHGIATE